MEAEPGVSRRALLRGSLVAGAGVALAGCTDEPAPPQTTRTITRGATPGPGDDDVALVLDAIAHEEKLLAYCNAMARRHPSTRDLLRPVRSRQQAHIDRLRAIVVDQSPPPTTAAGQVPADPGRARTRLVGRLEQARDERLDDCLAATAGVLAQQLASVSASHAASADQLATRSPR